MGDVNRYAEKGNWAKHLLGCTCIRYCAKSSVQRHSLSNQGVHHHHQGNIWKQMLMELLKKRHLYNGMTVQRTEPLWRGNMQRSNEYKYTAVNLVLQQEQGLAKQEEGFKAVQKQSMKQDNNDMITWVVSYAWNVGNKGEGSKM